VVRVASHIHLVSQGGEILAEVADMAAANQIGGRPWRLGEPKFRALRHSRTLLRCEEAPGDDDLIIGEEWWSIWPGSCSLCRFPPI
jgi:hypothetical protein